MPSLSSDNVVDKRLRRNISAFKIMTVTRGYTEEADKLLNYLVRGSVVDSRSVRVIALAGIWHL